MNKRDYLFIGIPKQPKTFIFEEANLVMTLKNIKDFARDYNFTYTLDYINAKVKFENKTK